MEAMVVSVITIRFYYSSLHISKDVQASWKMDPKCRKSIDPQIHLHRVDMYFLFRFRTSSSSIQAHMSAVKSLGESDGKRNFEDFLSNLVSRDSGGSPKGACAPGL